MPVGTLIIWPQSTAPSGYLECNGAAYYQRSYANLFALTGTIYGTGSGVSGTFRVPDLRGEFIRGWDHDRGTDPEAATRTNRGDGETGNKLGTKQSDAIRNITGKIYRANSQSAYAGAFYKETGNFHTDASSGSSGNFQTGFDASHVVRTAKDNQPRNVAMMYVIKY